MKFVDSAINLTYGIIVSPFKLTGKLVGLFAAKKPDEDACPLFSDIPPESDSEKIDAAWPPAPHPVEALPVQTLIRANGKLVRDLCYATTLSEDESQRFLLPIIANLARIVHLTPASEFDHHQGYGGLFTHSLEVAYYAANEAKTAIFDRSASPKELHQNKRRWILTAVLAALTHDIGKPFTDMDIVADTGQHWVQDEPIVDWLRKNRIKSYYISFRPSREHNQHKSAALANSAMLIPKETFTFLGLTGYGEQMMKEFRNAVLKGREGGLIGKILDNADGLSRNTDSLRQRMIRPEFKNVAHPQGDALLKAIRVLVSCGKWTINRDKTSRVFNTKQGCYIVWNETVVAEVREQAVNAGVLSLPADMLRLAVVLVDAGAAMRNTDEVSNTHNIFWRITPIVLGNVQLDCVRLADPRLIFDATPPVEIETIVEGLPIDDFTKKAWEAKWKYLPVQRLTRAEEEAMGYTDEFITSLTETAEQRLREADELAAIEAQAGMDVGIGATDVPPDYDAPTPTSEGETAFSPVSDVETGNLKATDESSDDSDALSSAISSAKLLGTPIDATRHAHKQLSSQDRQTASDKNDKNAQRNRHKPSRLAVNSQPENTGQVQTGAIPVKIKETRGAETVNETVNRAVPQAKGSYEPVSQAPVVSETPEVPEAPDDIFIGDADLDAISEGEVVLSDSDAPEDVALDELPESDADTPSKILTSEAVSEPNMAMLLGGAGTKTAKSAKKGTRQTPRKPQAQPTDGKNKDAHKAEKVDKAAKKVQRVAGNKADRSDKARIASTGVCEASVGSVANAGDAGRLSENIAENIPETMPENTPENSPVSVVDAQLEKASAISVSETANNGKSEGEDALPRDLEVVAGAGKTNLKPILGRFKKDHQPHSDTVIAVEIKNEAQLPVKPKRVQRVFFNEPVEPVEALQALPVDKPDPNAKGRTNIKAKGSGLADQQKPADKSEVGKRNAGRKRSAVDKDYDLAKDMIASMLSQLQARYGIWIADGVTTDPMTGKWSTSSTAFEAAVAAGQIDSDFVELELDKQAAAGTVPRIQWDQKAHRIILIES